LDKYDAEGFGVPHDLQRKNPLDGTGRAGSVIHIPSQGPAAHTVAYGPMVASSSPAGKGNRGIDPNREARTPRDGNRPFLLHFPKPARD
jgi:hypothetical protein